MTLTNEIKAALANGKETIEIKYEPGTTRNNSEYIDCKVGDFTYRVLTDTTREFANVLNSAVEELKSEYPNLHIITRKKEFHFYYPGFNSCHSEVAPVTISNKDISKEVVKTCKVTESYSMVGSGKLKEIFDKYPEYEVYCRKGFAYRGAQEGQSTREATMKTAQWAACIDINVIDNEIHVNAFSSSDMW